MSEHKWKVGDWAEFDGTLCVVTRVEGDACRQWRVWGVGRDPFKFTFETELLQKLKHLPGCTGWDWQPPKPPDGYRLLDQGEFIEATDLYRNTSGEWCKFSSEALIVGSPWKSLHHMPVARKVAPKYRDIDIRTDWGKECEFSDDGKHWFTHRLCGIRPQCTWPFFTDADSFKFARIKVD